MFDMRKMFFHFIYIVIVILLCLTTLEVYCRVKGMATLQHFRFTDFQNNKAFCPSTFLPFELIPNIPHWTNSFGMRDKERNINKPKGIYRIIIHGDSISMGSYPHNLEEQLNEDFNNKVEVWNCSIGGQGIREYYNYLKYRSLNYKPDMIIIGFCLNDFNLTPVMFKTADGELHCYRPFQVLKGNFDNWLYCHSNLYRFILATIEEKYFGKFSPYAFGTEYLGKIKAIAQERSIPLLAVIFPYFRSDSEESQEYKVMKRVINELNVECIDLHKIFKREERYKFLQKDHLTDFIHPNEEAHAIVAEVIRQHIKQKIEQEIKININEH